MQEGEDNLRKISLFLPRFFGGLACVLAALPILDRLVTILPPAIHNRDLALVLSTMVAYALIGREFLLLRPTLVERLRKGALPSRPSSGAVMLLLGVILLIVYSGYGEYVVKRAWPTRPLEEALLLADYIAMYSCLALGFWQMAFREYARHNNIIVREIEALKKKSSPPKGAAA